MTQDPAELKERETLILDVWKGAEANHEEITEHLRKGEYVTWLPYTEIGSFWEGQRTLAGLSLDDIAKRMGVAVMSSSGGIVGVTKSELMAFERGMTTSKQIQALGPAYAAALGNSILYETRFLEFAKKQQIPEWLYK